MYGTWLLCPDARMYLPSALLKLVGAKYVDGFIYLSVTQQSVRDIPELVIGLLSARAAGEATKGS